ncbi:DUF6519 domain-containing protein [Hymenobacter bucti]|uniref:DUF6519 domain-containing protein n=1 Tax=Hymenobacter bucti TaxID=1844114 RepID=A0ABW4R1J9_9BACT
MAGDYSRKTFDQEKHYSGVLMQQGRVQLDADWNEQLAIQQYRTETETTDLVGATGVPKNNDGFKIGLSGPGSRLTIAAGRLYVEGLLCELSQDVTYFQQPCYPAPSIAYFQRQLGSPPTSPPDAGQLTLQDGSYLVYLDAWQREINFRDDPHIQEVALGEADTTTRLQTVWQVRLVKVTAGSGAPDCQSAFPEWDQLIAPPTGKLNVQTKRNTNPKDPCALPPTSGFRRLENQLYRVEVQQGDNRTVGTFKWSRDDASVETRIEAIDGANLVVADLGRDSVLGFANGQWVEIVDETATLTSRPNALFQIAAIDVDKQAITLNSSADALKANQNLKLRRWDQAAAALAMKPAGAVGDWIDLEDGIQVAFTEGSYHPGDYWTFAARTATGEVEWPPFAIPNDAPLPQLPAGTKHHYCRLALVQALSGVVTLQDCRKLFPSLTEITADDVQFNNTACQLPQAQTVQQAIEQLCQNQQGHCTLTASPGPGWEAVFDKIKEGQDAQICFKVGDYVLSKPVKISHKGHLKLIGGGPGTRILAPRLEVGLVFESCASVLVQDLYAEASNALKPILAGVSQLNGVLTFLSCPTVEVEHVKLQCGPGAVRTATCLTVRNEHKTPGSVRIRRCDLQVGHQQQGILLVNVTTALVENNTLRASSTRQLNLSSVVADKQQRAGLRQLLFSKAVLNASKGGSHNAEITVGDQRLSFKTLSPLRKAWQQLLTANPPLPNAAPADLQTHIKKLANRLLVDEVFRKTVPAFNQAIASLATQTQQVAAQGITVGGRTAQDIRVLNNTIVGSLQGVHVGLSHEQANHEDVDQAEAVTIAGNTIDVVLLPTASKQDRHGIFVGNCKSLLIENNNIRLNRLPDTDNFLIDGIRVWGNLGERLMITKNYVASADGNQKRSFVVGIHVEPLADKPRNAQWVVMWNMAPSKQTTVIARNGTLNVVGTNTP